MNLRFRQNNSISTGLGKDDRISILIGKQAGQNFAIPRLNKVSSELGPDLGIWLDYLRKDTLARISSDIRQIEAENLAAISIAMAIGAARDQEIKTASSYARHGQGRPKLLHDFRAAGVQWAEEPEGLLADLGIGPCAQEVHLPGGKIRHSNRAGLESSEEWSKAVAACKQRGNGPVSDARG